MQREKEKQKLMRWESSSLKSFLILYSGMKPLWAILFGFYRNYGLMRVSGTIAQREILKFENRQDRIKRIIQIIIVKFVKQPK